MRFLFWLSLFSALRQRNRLLFAQLLPFRVCINTVSCGSFSLFHPACFVRESCSSSERKYRGAFCPSLPLHTSNADTRCLQGNPAIWLAAACGSCVACTQRSAPCGSFSHKIFIRFFFGRSTRTPYWIYFTDSNSHFAGFAIARWIAL